MNLLLALEETRGEFNITVIQVYAPTSNAEEAEVERSYEELTTRPFRTNTQKRYPFHYRGLECKSRKSRNTWSNKQIWPWNTKWSRAKTNRVLPRKCTGHSKHPLPTTQVVRHYWATELNWLNWDVSYLTIWTVSSIERDSKLFPPLWFPVILTLWFFFFFLYFGKLHSTWARFGKTPNWKCSPLLIVKKNMLILSVQFNH